MPTPNIEDVRDRLLAQRDRIRTLQAEISHEEDELLESQEADWEDRSVNEKSAGVMEKIGYAEHRQLEAIEEALDRMARGTWGICDVCGCHIDPHRLEARPEATICSDCATAW